MPGKDSFEYAVIRWVPRVERGEFLNVGVALFCRGQRFLDMRYALDVPRMLAFHPDCDVAEIEGYLRAFQLVCHGGPAGGPIGALPPAERFRWLTANRSTVIQASPSHIGLSADAQATLERLFSELIG